MRVIFYLAYSTPVEVVMVKTPEEEERSISNTAIAVKNIESNEMKTFVEWNNINWKVTSC